MENGEGEEEWKKGRKETKEREDGKRGVIICNGRLKYVIKNVTIILRWSYTEEKNKRRRYGYEETDGERE
ncbi:MAG: hypothetical protein II951_08220 [Bacteroidales bacterium]|nr:hypothetical protein [Bacteroidales bacterium]